MKINVLCRFKIYTHLIVDDQKQIWELQHMVGKRTRPLRKLTYYKTREAYRYNNGYLKKSKLYELMYKSNEVIGQDFSETPF